jgi:hypothetical protein
MAQHRIVRSDAALDRLEEILVEFAVNLVLLPASLDGIATLGVAPVERLRIQVVEDLDVRRGDILVPRGYASP